MNDRLHHVANQAALAIAADDGVHESVLWHAEQELYEHYESLTWLEKGAPHGVILFQLGRALSSRTELYMEAHTDAHTVDIFKTACGWQGAQPRA
jgi:hypothetical protein